MRDFELLGIKKPSEAFFGSEAIALPQVDGEVLRLALGDTALAESRIRERATEERSRRNPVTGLPNIIVWDETLANYAEVISAGDPIIIFRSDIAGFKEFNDELGHPFGNRVLNAWGRIYLRHVRQGDKIASHPAGDEFNMLADARYPGVGDSSDRPDRRTMYPSMTTEQIAAAIAGRVQKDFRHMWGLAKVISPDHLAKVDPDLTIGWAIAQEGDTPQTLDQRADDNLYENKLAALRDLSPEEIEEFNDIVTRLRKLQISPRQIYNYIKRYELSDEG